MIYEEIRKLTAEDLTREQVVWLIDNIRDNTDVGKLHKYFSSEELIKNRFNTTKKTIVLATPSLTGTSWWRLSLPMLAIYKHTDAFNLIYTENISPWHYNVADLIVQHRCGDRHSLTHRVMDFWPKTKHKPVIIHNVDDCEFSVPKSHGLYSLWEIGHKNEQSIYSLSKSDWIEITTRKMKQTMLRMNKHVVIQPNLINWNLPQWNLPKYQDYDYKFWGRRAEPQYTRFDFFKSYDAMKDVIVGYAGLTSHFEDIKKMVPILKAVYDARPNTKFILAGMALKDNQFGITVDKNGNKIMHELPVTDEASLYGHRVRKLFSDAGFDESRILFYDALDLTDYGWFYSLFDINLAYVEHNSFNENKSPIKAFEGAFYKALPLISDFGGYQDFLDELPDALKVYRNTIAVPTEYRSDWVNRLLTLVDGCRTPEYVNLANALHEHVKAHYDIDAQAEAHINWYNSLIEQNIERETARVINDVFLPAYTNA